MNPGGWLDFLWSNDSLYFAVSCVVGVLLIVIEVVLVKLRERSILGYLGWSGRDLGPARARLTTGEKP